MSSQCNSYMKTMFQRINVRKLDRQTSIELNSNHYFSDKIQMIDVMTKTKIKVETKTRLPNLVSIPCPRIHANYNYIDRYEKQHNGKLAKKDARIHNQQQVLQRV